MREPDSSNHPSSEEQLSAAFDGENDGEVELAADHRELLLREWTLTGSLLREIPASNVDLLGTVRAEISTQSSVAAACRVEAGFRRRMGVRLGWFAGAATAVATMLLLLLPDGQRDAASFAPFYATASRVIRQTNPVSWNVVVVTIDREDALQEVMEDVIGQVSVLPPGSGGAAEFSAGMLLAAGVVPQSKLESLVVEGSGEWNPARIGRHSREEVKQRFIGALQDPSHSERVFGVRYVVGEDNVVISMVHLERDSADSSETAVAMTPRDSSLGSSRANTAKAESVDDAPQNDRTPLLVIFRSRSGSMPRIPDQGTLWTAPTGPAA